MKKIFSVLLILLVSNFFSTYAANALPDRVIVKFHYKRTTPSPEGYKLNYDDYKQWNLWIWKNSDDNTKDKNVPSFQMHKGHEFLGGFDNFGATAFIVIDGTAEFKDIGFLLRKSTNAGDWAERDIDVDRFINKFDKNGRAEIWLIQGDSTVYYSHPSPDKDDLIKQKIKDLGLHDNLPTCSEGEESESVPNPFFNPNAHYTAGWWEKEEDLWKCVPITWKIQTEDDGFRKLHSMRMVGEGYSNAEISISCVKKKLHVYVWLEYADSVGFRGSGQYRIDKKSVVKFNYTVDRQFDGFFFDNPSTFLKALKSGKKSVALKVSNVNSTVVLEFPVADYRNASSAFAKKSGCKLP